MKCLIFFMATAFFCQTATSWRTRRRHYHLHPDHSIIINEDPYKHPPWWRGSSREVTPSSSSEGSSETTEVYEVTLGGSSENSSDEDNIPRPPGVPRTPGYGRPSWWRPPAVPNTTTAPPEEPDLILRMCIRSCRVTTEYNPVCGTNNVSYSNLGRLECEQQCGVQVQFSKFGPCTGSELTKPINNEQQRTCIRSCPVTGEYNPLCGTDNVTYANPGRLECAQNCGVEVKFSKLGPCTGSELTKPINNEQQRTCIRSCPVTGEYNPLCGTDNVTYANPGRLECAQNCGVAVLFSSYGACSNSGKPVITEEQVSCIKSCPVTGEFNPVCGSDNITYANPSRLECAQNCGVVVALIKQGTCGISELTPTTETGNNGGFAAMCMRSCPVTAEYNPVCGSNNITYANPGRLECAQNCGVAVELVRKSSCEAPITIDENNVNGNNNVETTVSNTITNKNTTTQRPYVNNDGNDNTDKNYIKNNSTGPNLNNNDSSKGESTNNAVDNNNEKNNDAVNDYNHINLDGNSFGPDWPRHPNNSGNANRGNNNCKENSSRKPPSLQNVMACMQTCSLTSESNPVCGTDSITYMNPGRLLCAQFCGVDVSVEKFAPCDSTYITNVHCLSTCTNPPVIDKPELIPLSPHIQACMEACPASFEYNPVCGTNDITYRNIEKLQCARRCGVDVSLKRNTHCSAPEVEPIPKDNATLLQECIEQCSVPLKYEPLCGSNNVTYNNTGHLICARQCGLDIDVMQLHACSIEPEVTPSPTPITNPTTEKATPSQTPITEKVTPSPTPITNPTTEKSTETVTPGPNGLNFTIDPDILANIWGTTSSTTTPNNDDEDFELDHRIQDG